MRTLLLCVLATFSAQGHFDLLEPKSAIAVEDGGKGAPPCGDGDPSNVVTAARGGHPIAIRISEFIFHPGHYRFALSVNSRAELPADPPVVSDSNGNSISASIQSPVKAPVLADGVFAHTSPPRGDLETTITLPNLTCEKCTLQVIEFMADHGPNPGGGYFYHHCADLRITADPALPPADAAWPRTASQNLSVAPYVVAGSGWTTSLVLINTSAAPVPATVTFRTADATGAAPASITVDPNATVIVPFGDPTGPLTKGWAEVRGSGALGGFVLARFPPGELVFMFQTQTSSSAVLAFDNADGATTTISIANVSASSADITATFFDDHGNRIASETTSVAPSSRLEWNLPDQVPSTARLRGVIRIQGPGGATLAAQAIRFFGPNVAVALPPL
ncbi:MAG: SCE4755 family polysaccharide monooxygenase-like protein [Bryobacteraceae bacterium]